MKKNIAVFFFVVVILINNVFAGTDTNTDSKDVDFIGSSEYDQNYCWNYQVRGARVSLWNVDEQSLIYSIDMITFNNRSYAEVSNYRCLSYLTKPEIIKLNYVMTGDMENNYENNKKIADNLCPESIVFPELFAKNGISATDRTKNIKDFYSIDSNKEILISQFSNKVQQEEIDLWKIRKAVILIEPLLCVFIGGQDASHTWLLTCAELGLLAYNGLAQAGEDFAVGRLYACYKHLPFGTFKENDGLITCIKPYDQRSGLSDSNRACQTMDDFKDMINCLGCLEMSNIEMIDRNPATQTIEYYTNSWVITGVNVYSENGCPYQSDSPGWAECSNGAKSNCLGDNGLAKITYTFDSDVDLQINSYTHSIAIPEHTSAISWVKWKCPPVACNIIIHITTNSANAIPENDIINIKVIDPISDKYPPNTEATDRNDNFMMQYIADGSWNIGNQTSLSWTTYNYNWHYDWHCICRETSHGEMCENEISLGEYDEYGSSGGWDYEETDSGGKKKVYWNDCSTCSCNYSESVSDNHTCKHCTFSKEDWGWVEWTETTHTLSLEVKKVDLKRSEKSPNTNNSDYSIKSGYGIELNVNTDTTYRKNNSIGNCYNASSMVVPPQYMEMFLPEYYYETYEITSFNDIDENGYDDYNDFELPINPYSQFEQNCHFTPIWYPDGKYVVGIKVSQAFCPTGMLSIIIDNANIEIDGNVYDDWHIAPEMN